MILGDLTRANAGSLSSVLKKLPLNPDQLKRELVIVIHPHQKPEITDWPCKQILEVETNGADPGEAVYAEIKARIAVASNRPVHVLTFSTFVLRLQERFDAEEKTHLTLRTWGRAYELGNSAPRPAKVYPEAWNIPGITEREAVAALVKALEGAEAYDHATGVVKTVVRPLVAAVDSRLSTQATAGSTAVVSNLISAAKRAGFIEFDETPQSPSHLRIWLKEPKKNTAQLDLPYESVEEKSRDKYQQTLRGQSMGAFPNFREDVYEQMQLLLSGDEKLSVGNFVRKAVQTVAQKHSAEHKRFSFASLQNFIMTLLKNAPVMKSETGELLMPSFSHMSHIVHSLADNWKEKLDGQIIVCLLKNGCAISMYDLPALTGAMYPTRDGDNQDKVQKVIELLKVDGKITYGDDDSLVLVG